MGALLKQLGFYALHEPLGVAGDRTLYAATDARTQQRVLLNVLDTLNEPDEQTVRQFVRLGESGQRLRHDNILTILDFGEIDRRYYVAIEPPRGVVLPQLLRQKERRLSFHDRMATVQQIAAALEHAHAQGCLHGALTPDVVWVDSRLHVQISMFGGVETTTDGAPMVTPFCAPEQLFPPAPIDARTDVYRLCALAYWLLLGRAPFHADSQPSLRRQITYMPPLSPRSIRADLPVALAAVLTFGLAKEPLARYGAPSEFAAALLQAEMQAANSTPARRSTSLPIGSLRQLFATLGQRSLTTLNSLKLPGQ
ncbi:MAG: serine/threonine protein kinase [Caldilineaceae bacterium]|nr:serine/threonine protein kinase [Caldilineaceae bacterium]